MTITRGEIAQHLAAVPAVFPAGRGEILDAAARAGASEGVLALLRRLPERSYGHLRDLWPFLPQVPVE